MRKAVFLLMMTISIFTAGCNIPKPQLNESNNEPAGRKETIAVQAADFAGYNGKAVRKTIDKVLDQNDRRQKEIDRIIGQ